MEEVYIIGGLEETDAYAAAGVAQKFSFSDVYKYI